MQVADTVATAAAANVSTGNAAATVSAYGALDLTGMQSSLWATFLLAILGDFNPDIFWEGGVATIVSFVLITTIVNIISKFTRNLLLRVICGSFLIEIACDYSAQCADRDCRTSPGSTSACKLLSCCNCRSKFTLSRGDAPFNIASAAPSSFMLASIFCRSGSERAYRRHPKQHAATVLLCTNPAQIWSNRQ